MANPPQKQKKVILILVIVILFKFYYIACIMYTCMYVPFYNSPEIIVMVSWT